MRAGIAVLVIAYTLSQFYRAFLAVLSPALLQELGATTADLARASGLWFAAFALMQLPVGWALDTIGPRRTASVLFLIGGAGGAAVFASAQGPGAIMAAMVLIGIGCAPILMATYYIFARQFSAAVFGTLAGVTVGVSSLGNILSAAPLAGLIAAFGWRTTVGAFAVLTALVALAIWTLVRDPTRPEGEARGSLMDLLRMPALWPIMAMMFVCYAPAAGLRGLWISPYVNTLFGADLAQIGTATLVMGLAMVAGNFLYGPADRLFGGRKRPILIGNAAVALMLLSFWVVPPGGLWPAIALFAAIGLLGASYPIVISHGRSFCPPHLTGRGVTLLNLFGMGGAGVMQFASGPGFSALAQTRAPAEAYGALFGIIGLVVLAGLSVYLWSKDSPG
ncbi:MFS transporter [Roseicyclus sp.]|uniref:MFS transporter n=1 Tax=Roseicyclus sp. TaxID=1914329 RepID=UPI003F6CD308